jgi:hypothetical protein
MATKNSTPPSVISQLATHLQTYWQHWAIGLFFLSRLIIFFFPPAYVSYFEQYANQWHYGLSPYFEQWFEYPPLAIPFVWGPLLLDLAGVGVYRVNFRFILMLADIAVFATIFMVIKKNTFDTLTKFLCLLFYIVLTLKAKDFIYENFDQVFSLCMLLPAVMPLWSLPRKDGVSWLSYWLAVGIKLVNAPLAFLYWFASDVPLKWRWLAPAVTFALTLAGPIAYFRSALMVVYVYHRGRTLQIESIPSLIVRGIDLFTHTEHIYLSFYKSFDLEGPLSNVMLPLSMVVLIGGGLWWAWSVFAHRHQARHPYFLLKYTLFFIFVFLMANKVFSTNYHLWYVPLLAIYPFRTQSERLKIFALAALFLGVATSPIPKLQIGSSTLDMLLPIFLQLPAGLALSYFVFRLQLPTLKSKG